MVDTYTKITVGFVTQTFEKKGDRFVCTNQEFIAGDQVDYEIDGKTVEVDTSKEEYQKYEMRATDHGDFIDDRWHITDVQDRADDMDKDKIPDNIARKILHLCHSEMDANIGINWDVIDYWTDEVLDGNSK